MKSCPNCRTKVDSTFTLHCPECGTSIDPSVASMPVPRAQPAGDDPGVDLAGPEYQHGRGPSGVGRFFRGIGLRMLVAGVVLGGSALWGAITDADADPASAQDTALAETSLGDSVSASELAIGDCMMWPDGEDSFFSLERRSCDMPHDAEMYALVSYPADDAQEYPGNDPIAEWSVQACYEQFESYVGRSYEDAQALDFTFFTPTEVGWRKYADREVQCVIYNIDESPLVGSVRAAA